MRPHVHSLRTKPALWLLLIGLLLLLPMGGCQHLNGMEEVWSLEGDWSGVASDPKSNLIYAVGQHGKCVAVDLAGRIQRKFTLNTSGMNYAAYPVLRLAKTSPDGDLALLIYTFWIGALEAYDLNGNLLWSRPDGINDVWTADLNGDGMDEVIIGYNGASTLQVLDAHGRTLQRVPTINAWHVCAGDILGDGSVQVLFTENGVVRVLDPQRRLGSVRGSGAHYSPSMVRVGTSRGKPAVLVSEMRLVDNTRDDFLTALSPQGGPLWSLDLPTWVCTARVAPGKPWLAVGLSAGVFAGPVYVVDTDTGALVATASLRGNIAEVCWARDAHDESPLLLVANHRALKAFRLVPHSD